MSTTITLDGSAIVKRSLSIIGKRSIDADGNLRFAEVTLGSREEGIIGDFVNQAAADIAAETSAFVSAATSATSITLTFPTNQNSALSTPLTNACTEYCVAYALWSWFNATHKGIAEKYHDDCQRLLSDIFMMIHTKTAPSASADPSNPTVTVT